MKTSSIKRALRNLIVMIVVMGAIIPIRANAQQIAQGYVGISIGATLDPNITTSSASCTGTLTTRDPNIPGAVFSTSVNVDAVVASNQLYCDVVVPYYWSLSALTGTIDVSYGITALGNTSTSSKTTLGSVGSIAASKTGSTFFSVGTIF